MLLVIFHIGSERYGLDSREVIEIVPLVRLKKLPHAPEYVRGLFRYRGQVVPVVDLSAMVECGLSKTLLSSRIIMVRYPDVAGREHVLGLLAERVTETIKIDEADFSPHLIKIKDSAYLGEIITYEQGMIQRIRLEGFPDAVREILFPADEGGAADASEGRTIASE
jgi:chemotaxis-related protein WspB